MSYNDKVLKSLDTALNYYNSSLSVIKTTKDKATLENHFWHILSELEYTLFVLSLMFNKEEYEQHLPKQDEIEKNNIPISKLLNNAKQYVMNNDMFEAYKNVYMARYYATKIYNLLKKKEIK